LDQNQRLTVLLRHPLRTAVVALALLVAAPAVSWAYDEIVFSAGMSQPLGTTSDFAAQGDAFELRWRHWNRGRSAYEVAGGFSEHGLEGEIQSTINGFESLVRAKNQLAQLQGTSPGTGSVVAEYGTLDTYYLNANYIFRFLQRARISPTISFGAGGYYWKLPFRVKFYNVPSFGEQHPWLPIGAPNNSSVYAFDFEEQVLDYTKSVVSGGLSAAFGLDFKLTGHLNVGGEARAHLIFSSGQGNLEEGIDDQPYLDNMTFLYVQGSLNYRF
jgi:hypothetical protein